MASTLALKIGESHHLALTVVPPNGDTTSLIYSTPDSTVQLAPDAPPASGVTVKGIKAGLAKVFATVDGANASGTPAKVQAQCDVTVAASIPLVTALALVP